jgi:ketosteroid isomerase-like protein
VTATSVRGRIVGKPSQYRSRTLVSCHWRCNEQEAEMLGRLVMALPILAGFGATVAAADFDATAAHAKFMDAFNNRDWAAVKAQLAEDSVFHRANAAEVQSGPDAIVAHFEQPIGGEWNVKFARLDSKDQLVGNDGRVVERGDFAITAGPDDSACYAGSYLATWVPDGDAWRLQMLTWQDLETEVSNCK